jgi:putative phosphoesterase
MRLGVISDIHGNYVALRACLSALEKEKVDRIFCLGDIIGYLPIGNEVLSIIFKNGITSIKGNHEAMLVGEIPFNSVTDKIYAMTALRNEIDEYYIERIKGLSAQHELELNDKKILFIHGGPKSPLTEYVYENYDMNIFRDLPYDCFFIGHTHLPFIHESPSLSVINVGSCGLPRDYGSLGCCAIYDTDSRSAVIIRVPFEIKELVSVCEGKIHPCVLSVFNRKNEFKGRILK